MLLKDDYYLPCSVEIVVGVEVVVVVVVLSGLGLVVVVISGLWLAVVEVLSGLFVGAVTEDKSNK